MAKRNALCKSNPIGLRESCDNSLRIANKHKIKVFKKLDAENAKLDQIPLFKDLK